MNGSEDAWRIAAYDQGMARADALEALADALDLNAIVEDESVGDILARLLESNPAECIRVGTLARLAFPEHCVDYEVGDAE